MSQPRRWPFCEAIDDNCVAYNLGTGLGGDLLSRIIEFIHAAHDGARLTLQRNHEGFTLQVTEEVQTGRGERLTPVQVGSAVRKGRSGRTRP